MPLDAPPDPLPDSPYDASPNELVRLFLAFFCLPALKSSTSSVIGGGGGAGGGAGTFGLNKLLIIIVLLNC